MKSQASCGDLGVQMDSQREYLSTLFFTIDKRLLSLVIRFAGNSRSEKGTKSRGSIKRGIALVMPVLAGEK